MHGWGHHRGMVKAAEDMHDRLDRFAALAKFNIEFEDAFEFFFSEPIDFLQEYVSEEEFSRFMEWFIHDYVLSDGGRVIEKYDREHGSKLPGAVRRMLRSWMGAHLSLLEFRARTEDGFELVDLLTGTTHVVSSRSFPEGLHPWSVIIGRPLSIGERDFMSPAYTVLPPAVKASIIPLMRGEFGRAQLRQHHLSVADFLRENGHLFYDFVTGLDEWISRSVEQSMEALTITCARAVFTVSDREAAIDKLIVDDRIRRMGVLRFILNEHPKSAGGKRVRAEIVMIKNRMQVTSVSFDGLQKVKDIIDIVCGDTVRHRLDVYEDRVLPRDVVLHDAVTMHKGSPLEKHRLTEAMKQMEYAKSIIHPERGRGGAEPDWSDKQNALKNQESPPDMDNSDVYVLGEQPKLWDDLKQKQVAESATMLLKKVYEAEGDEQAGTLAAANAAWMWWAYCTMALPKVRNVDTWAAALYYCISHVEDKGMTRKACAELFDVSPASVSNNVKRIIDHLRLAVYDDRYCVRYPLDDLVF